MMLFRTKRRGISRSTARVVAIGQQRRTSFVGQKESVLSFREADRTVGTGWHGGCVGLGQECFAWVWTCVQRQVDDVLFISFSVPSRVQAGYCRTDFLFPMLFHFLRSSFGHLSFCAIYYLAVPFFFFILNNNLMQFVSVLELFFGVGRLFFGDGNLFYSLACFVSLM